MKNAKKQEGITLVALVVTIVVLLILAGITIAYVLADGGIFDTAKSTKVENEKGLISDYASQGQATFMIDTFNPNVETASAETSVTSNFPTTGYTLTGANTLTGTADGKINGTFTVVSDRVEGYTFTVKFTNGVAEVDAAPTTPAES